MHCRGGKEGSAGVQVVSVHGEGQNHVEAASGDLLTLKVSK